MSVDELQARVRVLADKHKTRLAANRQRFPEFAEFVADFRGVFGDGVRVRWVKFPDGTEEGKRWQPR